MSSSDPGSPPSVTGREDLTGRHPGGLIELLQPPGRQCSTPVRGTGVLGQTTPDRPGSLERRQLSLGNLVNVLSPSLLIRKLG